MELLFHGVAVGLIGLGIGAAVAQTDGPASVFKATRWVLSRAWLPKWLSENADCIFCWSFYGCVAGALLLLGLPVGMSMDDMQQYSSLIFIGYGSAVFMLKYTGH